MKKRGPEDATTNTFTRSSYLNFLPRVFHESEKEDQFLGTYLKIFERVWGNIEDNHLLDYMFSLPKKNKSDLLQKRINDELAKRLAETEHGLSKNAQLIVVTEGASWVIEDHDNLYYIIEENEVLNVYLTGKKGIEELIDIIPELFHPRFSFLFPETNTHFLPELEKRELQKLNKYFSPNKLFKEWLEDFLVWFAKFTALTLRNHWSLQKKRQVISEIIPLYRIRGTKIGLEKYLSIYVGEVVEIKESITPMRLGVNSFVEGSFALEGSPYFFQVYLKLERLAVNELRTTIKSLIEIIETEKPAHTYYKLNITLPDIEVEKYSRVGVDTILGE